MLENKEQEKIAGIISDFFDGAVNEADIDILAMKIYEKYVAKLEQDLEFTTKTANELIEIKHKLEQELNSKNMLCENYNCGLNKKIQQLEQELAELKEKDNYHLRYELAGADESIANLKKQLEEKDKEIERLKVFEKAYYFNQTQVSQESMDLLLQNAYQVHNETQLAIQELEKVKDFICDCTYIKEPDYTNVRRKIDNQIKELKGE